VVSKKGNELILTIKMNSSSNSKKEISH